MLKSTLEACCSSTFILHVAEKLVNALLVQTNMHKSAFALAYLSNEFLKADGTEK